MLWMYLHKICPRTRSKLNHMHDAFSPHTQLKSPHIAPQPPPHSTHPISVTGTVRNHSLTASTPTKSENECTHLLWWEQSASGRGEGDMASVQEACESLRLTNIDSIHHEYFMKHKLPLCSHVLLGVCVFFVCVVVIYHLLYQRAATSSQSGVLFWGVWECVKCECDRMCLCGLCDLREATEWLLWCVCVCGLAFCTDPKLRLIPPTATPVSTPDTTNQPFWMQRHEVVRLSLPFLHLDHWRWNNRTVFKNKKNHFEIRGSDNMQNMFVWRSLGGDGNYRYCCESCMTEQESK